MVFQLKAKLVKIGNSQGIRIPRTVIDQLGFEEEVEMMVEADRLIIRPAQKPRRGWEPAFAQMAARSEDALLDEWSGTDWDDEEWQW